MRKRILGVDLKFIGFQKRLIAKDSIQKGRNFRVEFGFMLPLKDHLKNKSLNFFGFLPIPQGGSRMTIAQGEADGWIRRYLGLCLSPVFDEGYVARTLPGNLAARNRIGQVDSGDKLVFSHGNSYFVSSLELLAKII